MCKKISLLLLLVLILGGCSDVNAETPGRPRLVTGISAVYQKGAIRLERQYSDDEKMGAVLDYLRLLKTYGPAEVDPEATDGSRIQITLRFSDGSQKVYDQWADQFLRCDGGKWEQINPEQGQELALLLGMLESDEIF